MIDSRLIALQGFGLSPIALAVQGLIDYVKSSKKTEWDTSQGVAGGSKTPDMTHYVNRLHAEHQRQLNRQRDDQLATEFIMALIHSEIL